MSVAVATLGCTRKRDSIKSWSHLLQLEGDYKLYINWEKQKIGTDEDFLQQCIDGCEAQEGRTIPVSEIYVDIWNWRTVTNNSWRQPPRFDQDQARLASIVTARNMCIEFAMQTDCSHLLFIDADIIPPLDIIPKMLAIAETEDAVCGLVNGRGVHSHMNYVFQSKGMETIAGAECQRVEHANIGFTMLSRRLFNQIRFRYGITEYDAYIDASGTSPFRSYGTKLVSDDPAYHWDAFVKFGKWPVIRMDVIGRHVGELHAPETSQF